VRFLNKDCRLVHGNINLGSVFVTGASEWKLSGFDTLCNLDEPDPALIVSFILFVLLSKSNSAQDIQQLSSPF
jgi:hypothetical protein